MRISNHSIGQNTLSFCLALYVGGLLNLSVFYRQGMSGRPDALVDTSLAALAVIAVCYFLFSILALGGQWTYRLGGSFVLLFSAAASYYMTFFNVVIGYGVVVSVLTTDIDLSKEAFGYKFVIWIVFAAVLPILLLLRVRLINNFYDRLKSRWRGLPALTFLLLAIGVAVLSLQHLETLKEAQVRIDNQYTASASGIVAHSFLPTNWIAGTGLYLSQLVDDDETEKSLLNPAEKFTYTAAAPMEDTYVVFVIGETTRSDHVGLLGYQRDTTPLLGREKNLVALKGISCDTATKLSLRCMFVRPGGASENEQRTLKERNVFAVLKTLGFSSELYALQSEVWFYNSIDPDSFEIREVVAAESANTNKPIDDMLLVNELEKSVARHPHGKHLVVLHTKGSHWLYSQRYPRTFARYQPECLSIDATCSKQQLVNSFDNSVLYVDYVLEQAINRLRDKNAIIFYSSDHGESIDENTHFHAAPRAMAPPEQFRVPFFVWASDRFLATPSRAAGFAQLKALQAAGATKHQTDLFDSILGCIGYVSPDGGINSKNNWCQVSGH
ncbi:MAG: kdo(2)-lipid A phosphoethanolamine 7''-transferase [Herbaspirillum sp.]